MTQTMMIVTTLKIAKLSRATSRSQIKHLQDMCREVPPPVLKLVTIVDDRTVPNCSMYHLWIQDRERKTLVKKQKTEVRKNWHRKCSPNIAKKKIDQTKSTTSEHVCIQTYRIASSGDQNGIII